MERAAFPFGTSEAIKFKEPGCDAEFSLRAGGMASIQYYDKEKYGEGAMKTFEGFAKAALSECIAEWPKDKLRMCSDNRTILGGMIEYKLYQKGVFAKIEIKIIKLMPENEDIYAKLAEQRHKEEEKEKATKKAAEGEHGPLVGFRYGLTSHGMMAGTGSSSDTEVQWLKSGEVLMTESYNGYGTESKKVYRLKPMMAETLREYVVKAKLAELSKEKTELPLCYDNFTSASINMTFDETGYGGSPYEDYHLFCGPSKMTFGQIEKKITELFDGLKESAELLSNEAKTIPQNPGGFPFMTGTVTPVKPANADPSAWTCPECGCPTNTGKFCTECGKRRE